MKSILAAILLAFASCTPVPAEDCDTVLVTNVTRVKVAPKPADILALKAAKNLERFLALAEEIATWADPDPGLNSGLIYRTQGGFMVSTGWQPESKAETIRKEAASLTAQAAAKEAEAKTIEERKKKVEEFRALLVVLKPMFGGK